MEYVHESLSSGEKLFFVGHFHWMYTAKAALNILWGILGCIILIVIGTMGQGGGIVAHIRDANPGLRLAGFLVLLLGVFQFARMMVVKATTEVAVTSSRVIYKRGVVSRKIGELSIDRIEGADVSQTVLGRIFGYGHVVVHGMGIGRVNLPVLADPVGLDRAIREARGQ